MTNYAFILGRQPEIASAEILSRLKTDTHYDGWSILPVIKEVMFFDLRTDINIINLFQQLGGSVKLVEILEHRESVAYASTLASWVIDSLSSENISQRRLLFGVSLYGSGRFPDLRKLLIEVDFWMPSDIEAMPQKVQTRSSLQETT